MIYKYVIIINPASKCLKEVNIQSMNKSNKKK